MYETSRKEIIEIYLEKKRSGMDYSEIRTELIRMCVDAIEIKSIIASIDQEIIHEDAKKTIN